MLFNVNDTRTAKFEYTARSYWLLSFFTIVELIVLVAIYLTPLSFQLWLLAAVILFVSFNVTTVTIQADRELIVVTFGIGFINKTIYVSEISKIKMRPNNTFYSIYSGCARQALEITERSGRRTFIGLGETRQMLEFFRGHARGE